MRPPLALRLERHRFGSGRIEQLGLSLFTLPIGRLADRREERELITDYRAMLEEVMEGLKESNHTIAVACASLPDQVRGYGPVKADSVREYKALRVAQLHRFHNPASAVQVQEVA